MLKLFYGNHYYEALSNNILFVPAILMVIAILLLKLTATNSPGSAYLIQDNIMF